MTKLTRSRAVAVTKPHRQPNPAVVYVASLAVGSRATVRSDLQTIATIASSGVLFDQFPWQKLRHEHTAAIRAQLAERYSARTTNKMLCFLRGTLRTAWHMELMAAEDFHRAASIKSVRGTPKPAGRALEETEVDALIETALETETLQGIRDAAVVATLYGAGLRRAELSALDVEHWNGEAFEAQGKGNKWRLAPLASSYRGEVTRWTKHRDTGPLFVRIRKGDALTETRLGRQGVNVILADLGHRARVGKFTPHDLRRSFGTRLLDRGVDLVLVQHLMGHENIATTAGYDRRGEAAKMEAVEKLSADQRRKQTKR